MDFDVTPEEEAFRQEVRLFLDDHLPAPEDRGPGFLQHWHAALVEKKWIGFAWPREEGGGGGSIIEQFILKEEMSARRAPPLGSDFMGLTWVGPALIRHGSDAQKERFLPDLLGCRSVWCTGYSEPDYGSDLASLETRALLEGDEYVVTGQKIWTTLAHAAEWIFMLVRTTPKDDDQRSRYGGISCLLIPMDSEGIEVQPIPSLVGVHSFNQVFFDEVRVPVENRLGAEGEGWKVVMGALANERSGISEATGMVQHLDNLKALARRSKKNGRPALEDPSVRRRIASFETRISALRLNGMRHLTRQLQGEHPGSETSINKLLRGPLEIEMSDLAMGLLGSDAQAAGEWQKNSLSLHGVVIGGGTPNIQRNIIAERVLRLPKD
jgi:alkylation response protein AidB-like acyl-CoA dehydrogenase